jgi:general secretion pathway protein N
MMRLRHIALMAALALGAVQAHGANPPGALDQPPSNVVVPGPVEMLPQAGPQQRTPERPLEPTGNPLWAVPLSTLTATRDRPLFTPSRRAPAPAVAGPVAAPPPPPPPPPAEPARPQLVLVGAIASDTEGFAVFLDQATNNIIRLRTGQDHSGWVLRSVKGREATLQKEQQIMTLALPVPGEAPAIAAPGVPGRPQPSQEPL